MPSVMAANIVGKLYIAAEETGIDIGCICYDGSTNCEIVDGCLVRQRAAHVKAVDLNIPFFKDLRSTGPQLPHCEYRGASYKSKYVAGS